MPDTEHRYKNKAEELDKKGKHSSKAAPVTDETSAENEYDYLTDEDEIPLRRKTNAPKKRARKKKRAAKKRQQKLKKSFRLPEGQNIWDVVAARDDDSLIKPLRIFGKRIPYWPLIAFGLVVVLAFMIVMGNGNVTILNDDVTVVGLPSDLEDYTILVVSDLNGKRFGEGQSSLLRTINNSSYDMLLCVGDMIGEDGDPEPFYEFLDGINKPGKVYFICGDSDPGPYIETPRDVEGTLQQIIMEDWILGGIERGAHYVDAPLRIQVGESSIWLTPTGYLNLEATEYRAEWMDQMRQEEDGVVTGLESDRTTLPVTSYRYALARKFYNAANQIAKDDLVIALSHVVPDDGFISSISSHADDPDGRYLPIPELIVSGHYCGGVWHLPFGGAFYVPNRLLPRNGWFPAKEDVSGLSTVSECQVYITGGLSTTSAIPALPFRLFNKPEATLLHFSAKLPDSMLDQ